MDTKARLSKLAELRAKTDRQLKTFINSRLDLGLHLARVALKAGGNSFEEYSTAKRAYAEAASLLFLVRSLTETEHSMLESKREDLRQLIDRPLNRGPLMPRNECTTAELARGFWMERGCPDGSPEEDWFRAERELKTNKETRVALI